MMVVVNEDLGSSRVNTIESLKDDICPVSAIA